MVHARIRTMLVCLVLLSVADAANSKRDDYGIDDLLSAIKQDYQNGHITLDEMVLNQLKALRKPDNLPDKYRSANLVASKTPSRGISMALKEIRAQWNILSPSTQLAFTEAMARQDTEYTYDSPGGFFKFHYNTHPDSTHAVPSDDEDISGFPDFVEKCAAYADTTYNSHIAQGFSLPPTDGGLGGDEKYDIYFESTSAYGYTVPEGFGPMPWNDYFSHIVLNNTFLGFPPNDDPEGDQWGAAKVTVAHEYHHAVQFAYDGTEDTWIMELDAVHMEEIIFDLSNDCYNYLDNFFYYPQKSLMENSYHYYSCFIWGLFLAQKYDTSLMRAAWEGSVYGSTVYQTLSDTLLGRYGCTQDSAFAEFAVWNFCTSIRDDGLHHEEAANYPLVTVGQTHNSYPVTNQYSPVNPAGYGACYVQFFPDSNIGTLRVTFNGNISREWAAYIIKSTSENVHVIEKYELDPITAVGTIEIVGFESYYRVVLVGVNITEFSSGATFTYTADLLDPYAVDLEVLTLDSAVYSGDTRGFECLISNISPLYDIVDVFASDNESWTTNDTISKALTPGQDTIITIPVHPPQGTPLGLTSELHIQIQSWNDSSVYDTQTVVAKIVLQRGDLNFSGHVDITDLIYFVEYAFGGGPDPEPVLDAADFVCDGGVDIADMIAMVNYMFQGGSPSPCNPY